MKINIFLATLFIAPLLGAAQLKQLNLQKAPFELPQINGQYSDYSPVIDEQTMTIHHSRHHKAYIENLNKELTSEASKSLEKSTLFELLTTVSKSNNTIRNNAGGHWNHSFFWTLLSPIKIPVEISAKFKKEIEAAFGSVENFKEQFIKKGTSQFGSGWVWLIRNKENKLQITSTPNQDNPLMDVVSERGLPVLGNDVWEHAYYLTYQNKRADYLKNFFQLVDWSQIETYDKEAQKKVKDL